MTRQRIMVPALFATIILVMSSTKAEAQKVCESLKTFTLPKTTIVDAELNNGGKYITNDILRLTFANLPASCRVKAQIKPTEESDINVEVWLPLPSELPNGRYNGSYLGTGSGGYGGGFFDSELAQGINNGFATANTDMGTSPADGVSADNLVGHPEKWTDFAWRSTHLMTEFSKAVIKEFYGAPTNHSYFAGCSTGGQQALTEATRFPDDYDGILAGAPAYNRTHLLTLLITQYGAMHPSNTTIAELSSVPLPTEPKVGEPLFARAIREASQRAEHFAAQPMAKITVGAVAAKLDVVNRAVLNACLGRAGEPKTDTFLADPRDCTFDPETLQCPSNIDKPDCLTADQVSVMNVYYRGVVNPRSGAIIHPGNILGSETSNIKALGLAFAYYRTEPPFDSLFKWMFDDDLVKWVLDQTWDWRKLDFDRDVEIVDRVFARELNATNTDLSKFKSHGGKLILYSGWADPLIPPQTTINYYNAVTQTMFGSLSPENVEKTQNFARLFMAPGMWHCGAGIPSLPNAAGRGPNAFGGMFQEPLSSFDPQHDLLSALTQWVEKDKAPTSVIATKFKDDDPQHGIAMQRPICVFPEVPRYNGTGDPNLPENFKCVVTHAPDYNNQKPAPPYGP